MKKMLIPMFLLVGFIFTETLDQKQTRTITHSDKTIYVNPDAVKENFGKEHIFQDKIDYYENLKLNPSQEDPYIPNRDCVDTDNGATDPYGDDCAAYNNYPSWCGNYTNND